MNWFRWFRGGSVNQIELFWLVWFMILKIGHQNWTELNHSKINQWSCVKTLHLLSPCVVFFQMDNNNHFISLTITSPYLDTSKGWELFSKSVGLLKNLSYWHSAWNLNVRMNRMHAAVNRSYSINWISRLKTLHSLSWLNLTYISKYFTQNSIVSPISLSNAGDIQNSNTECSHWRRMKTKWNKIFGTL